MFCDDHASLGYSSWIAEVVRPCIGLAGNEMMQHKAFIFRDFIPAESMRESSEKKAAGDKPAA